MDGAGTWRHRAGAFAHDAVKRAELSAFNRVDGGPLGLYCRAVFIPADVRRLHGTEGRYKRTGIFSRACADHRAELAFFAFDDCGAGAAFYTDAQPFKETRECTGKLTGANWMAPLGAWLLSAILIFAGVVLGLRGTAGEPSDRQLLMTRFDAEASLPILRRGTGIFAGRKVQRAAHSG